MLRWWLNLNNLQEYVNNCKDGVSKLFVDPVVVIQRVCSFKSERLNIKTW